MDSHVSISDSTEKAGACLLAAIVLSAAIAAPVAGASTTTDSTTTDDAGPSVETDWADVLNDSAVIVAANVTDLGDSPDASVRFEYRENGSDGEWASSTRQLTASTGSVTDVLTGLEPGTEYEYRAVAETNAGIDRGDSLTIETPADRPEAETVGATAVTEDGATLATNVTDLGGEPSAEVWFSYSPADEYEPHSEWTETESLTVSSTGTVTLSVDGLESGTEYEFTSHIRTAETAGLSTGYERFATDDHFAVETGSATSVTETSATLTGTIVDFGGANAATARFEYRSVDETAWSVTEPVEPDSAGTVEADVTVLEPGTGYEFRVVGNATDGDTDTGAIETFETVVDPAVETGTATAVDDESATVTGELTDLGGADAATVAVQYRPAGDDAWAETDGTTLTAPGAFDASLEGLDSGTTYEYRAVVRTDGITETGETATVTTDVVERDPAVVALTGTEDSSPNPHAELFVDWRVTDPDGDLSSVTVTVRDGNGRVVERTVDAVAGDAAAGSLAQRVKHGAGDEYAVTLEVADEAGNRVTDRTVIDA